MNQKYKDKYEELRNNDLGAKQSNNDSNPKEEETYATPGNVRNIGFIWKDGRKMFLNYAYLVSVEMTKSDETSIIFLKFTSHLIKITGYNLECLFDKIMLQTTRFIKEDNLRYDGITEMNIRVILSIQSENQ